MPQVAQKTFRLHKAPKPNGRCRFYIFGYPAGKREKYWFRTAEEARAEMNRLNRQIYEFGIDAPIIKGDEIRTFHECTAIVSEFPGKTIYDAVHLASSFWREKANSITVEELCQRVLVYYDNILREDPTTAGNAAGMKYAARKFVAAFGTRAIKTLDGAEIRSWLECEKLSAKTRTNLLKYIKRMFNLARGWKGQDGNKLLEKDAFERVEGFGEGNREGVQVFTVEQMQTLVNVLRPEFVPLFTLNAFSGFRREEITRMDWSHIKLERRLIDLPAQFSKNGKRTGKRKLNEEIFENLVEWLTPYRRESGPVADFTKKEIQDEITRATKVAGFKWIKNALRDSFASYAVPIKGFVWTSLRCDHSEKVLRDRYHEVVMKADAERYWQIRPPVVPVNVIPMVA